MLRHTLLPLALLTVSLLPAVDLFSTSSAHGTFSNPCEAVDPKASCGECITDGPHYHKYTNGKLYCKSPKENAKSYCEDVEGDTDIHLYGAPATGLVIAFALDASVPPCPYDPQWDGHYEYAFGGAWFLACELACGILGTGGGALQCWETYADHPQHPSVGVYDYTLTGSLGLPVSFTVGTDQINNVPSTDPTAPECGDFESDYNADCVDACDILFGTGLDGTYQVYVQGTSGTIWAD